MSFFASALDEMSEEHAAVTEGVARVAREGGRDVTEGARRVKEARRLSTVASQLRIDPLSPLPKARVRAEDDAKPPPSPPESGGAEEEVFRLKVRADKDARTWK